MKGKTRMEEISREVDNWASDSINFHVAGGTFLVTYKKKYLIHSFQKEV